MSSTNLLFKSAQQEIQTVTKQLYSCISFQKGQTPELERLKTLFMADGKLTNNNAEPVSMTVDQFNHMLNEQVKTGALSQLYEAELWHRTEVFGKVAHRFSTYEVKFDWAATEPSNIGINSIQFVKVDDRWLVNSMAWNEQTETMQVPDQYLG
jgi:hypothetical protein